MSKIINNQEFIEKVNSGVSVWNIAKFYSVTGYVVLKKCCELKVIPVSEARDRRDRSKDKVVIDAVKQGFSCAAIKREIGVSSYSTLWACLENGVSPPTWRAKGWNRGLKWRDVKDKVRIGYKETEDRHKFYDSIYLDATNRILLGKKLGVPVNFN